jgi:hypothetical protein
LESGSQLPDGLTITSDGVIRGTPTTAGTSTIRVQVCDPDGPALCLVTKSLTLTVNPAPVPVTVSTLAPPLAVVGIPYVMPLTASGGTGTRTWTVDSGNLPAGLTLQPDGTITGTPTTPDYTLTTVRVTDSAAGTPNTTTATLPMAAVQALQAYTAPVLSGTNDNLTLVVAGSSTAPGATIVQSTSTGQDNELWTFTPNGMNWQIVNKHSNQCLTTDGIAGHTLYQTPCTGQTGQLWQTALNFGPDGFSWIRNPATNLYVDVAGASTADGAAIDTAPWNGGGGSEGFNAQY